jgi:U3 small nucleolar RNA-associated protein 14
MEFEALKHVSPD